MKYDRMVERRARPPSMRKTSRKESRGGGRVEETKGGASSWGFSASFSLPFARERRPGSVDMREIGSLWTFTYQ